MSVHRLSLRLGLIAAFALAPACAALVGVVPALVALRSAATSDLRGTGLVATIVPAAESRSASRAGDTRRLVRDALEDALPAARFADTTWLAVGAPRSAGDASRVVVQFVSPRYFEVLGARLLAGAWRRADAGDRTRQRDRAGPDVRGSAADGRGVDVSDVDRSGVDRSGVDGPGVDHADADDRGAEVRGVDHRGADDRDAGRADVDSRDADSRDFDSRDLGSHGAVDRDAAVISAHYWRTRFGARTDVIGSTFELGARQVRVVGIAEPALERALGDERRTDVWLPAAALAPVVFGRDELPADALDGVQPPLELVRVDDRAALTRLRNAAVARYAVGDGVGDALRDATGDAADNDGGDAPTFRPGIDPDARRHATLEARLRAAVQLIVLAVVAGAATLVRYALHERSRRASDAFVQRALGASPGVLRRRTVETAAGASVIALAAMWLAVAPVMALLRHFALAPVAASTSVAIAPLRSTAGPISIAASASPPWLSLAVPTALVACVLVAAALVTRPLEVEPKRRRARTASVDALLAVQMAVGTALLALAFDAYTTGADDDALERLVAKRGVGVAMLETEPGVDPAVLAGALFGRRITPQSLAATVELTDVDARPNLRAGAHATTSAAADTAEDADQYDDADADDDADAGKSENEDADDDADADAHAPSRASTPAPTPALAQSDLAQSDAAPQVDAPRGARLAAASPPPGDFALIDTDVLAALPPSVRVETDDGRTLGGNARGVAQVGVSASFFAVIGLRSVEGDASQLDAEGHDAAVISRTFARALCGSARCVGRTFTARPDLFDARPERWRVIAVVEDFVLAGDRIGARRLIYRPIGYLPSATLGVVGRDCRRARVAAALPGPPGIRLGTMVCASDRVDAAARPDRVLVKLLAALALVVASAGLAGIAGSAAVAVRARRVEMGVRIAVGATPARTAVRIGLELGAVVAVVVLALPGYVAWVERALAPGAAPATSHVIAAAVLVAFVAIACAVIAAWRALRAEPLALFAHR